MNAFIVLAAIVALGSANPLGGVQVTQDTLGNYNLNYNTDEATRTEQGFAGGKVIGSFTYKDKDGATHTIKYLASPESGFTAQGDLPRPVAETPEVAASRAAHLRIVERERSLLPPLREEVVGFAAPTAPVQFVPFEAPRTFLVDNTAELEAAKAQHFAAHQIALSELAEAYRKAPPSSSF